MLAHYHESVENGFWFRNAYARLLSELSPSFPSTWVEVGVFHGGSLAWLGVEVVNRGLPVTIHAVDTFQGWEGTLRGDALRASFDRNTEPLRAHLGERFQVHAMPSVEAARNFADGSLDVVWIDADHSYEAVLADIAAWWPKVRPGGWIGGDDYSEREVRRAVRRSISRDLLRVVPGDRNGIPWHWWLARKPAK